MIGGLIGVLGWLLRFARSMLVPKTKLEGREQEIFAERDRKLDEARKRRAEARARARAESDVSVKEAVSA